MLHASFIIITRVPLGTLIIVGLPSTPSGEVSVLVAQSNPPEFLENECRPDIMYAFFSCRMKIRIALIYRVYHLQITIG